ncbi:hypothetical protein [Azospirillum doebereinerae]
MTGMDGLVCSSPRGRAIACDSLSRPGRGKGPMRSMGRVRGYRNMDFVPRPLAPHPPRLRRVPSLSRDGRGLWRHRRALGPLPGGAR